ncbi:related to EBP2 - required for pre-rRNA processing and ribosomal subunit assembly [Melanopsichium pennsylvanicum]|uniref:Related to EBP2 - required for pre-rRNA processing and ribosomal subunit assembly n=2 Tax=Melanopsichium pennsylvanicum TaxID=63383 RepID=A0AAJ4XS69_9BASI|nr:related to EBP2-required for pre-rRNA processing and ribosomal subunit assembly [Melanopsichium pennsylvanicum 4]SNX87604.1 related to EBP2 - required for pre-rRNA processing and ribosomal subunit assembly [Melanopsichium pennsylvanicum]
MPATPKSTPKKASAVSTLAGSPSTTTSTPNRMTRAQARASGIKIKTPSPLKKGTTISTPKSTPKKSAPEESASPPKANKTPAKTASPKMASPKTASQKAAASPKKGSSPTKAQESPTKVPASHAKLTRKPTSGLATAQPIVAEYSEEEQEDDDDDQVNAEDAVEEEEEEEDEEEDEESDVEEGQDVSEKGMQRLMEALGDDGLDEVDMAALDELAGDEEEEEEEEQDINEEDVDAEESDEEDAAEVEEQDADIPRVIPNANGDTLAASIARSGLAAAIESEDQEDSSESEEDREEDDEENVIAYEDLPDDIELSEQAKASRVQRIKINNEAALRRIYSDMRLDNPSSSSKLPWIETMRVTYPNSISSEVTDVENDLERELAFYKQALHAAVEGKKLVEASGTLFSRPSDYFAEMVKTDEHMERIRQKLLDETAAIKASEAAKKQRELKKFGKKVQVEKLQERIRNKKEMNERVNSLKRKHGGANVGDDTDGDDFDVRVEEAIGERPAKKQAMEGKGGRSPTNKAKMPRNARDAKYGFGGKKKYSKSNTAESTNDFRVGPTRGARGSKPKTTSGKAGFRPKQKSGAAKRPGKARRAGH